MRAIPLYILNKSATLYQKTGVDEYGNPTYGTAIPIGSIYVERSIAVTNGSLGETADGTLTLYFDCENSTPSGQQFNNLDKVVYKGVSYLCRNAVPLPNPMTDTDHHWEITLYGN